jgi:predicted TIM-barrel fold metal-dependent hydrolase
MPAAAARCAISGILGEPAPGQAETPGQARAGAGPYTAHMRPFYEIALAGFGPDRLMFGSDWPVSTLTARYADVHAAARALTADLSEPEKHAVFCGTAVRTYGLEPPR